MIRWAACLLVGLRIAGSDLPAARACAEELPFTIDVREVPWAGAPALQSFALARDKDGRWLCLGGRTAGLHGMEGQALAPSNFEGFNDRAWVVDLPCRRATSRALADLVPKAVADSLTVTGAQSVQVGDKLYIVGGYGYSPNHLSMRTCRALTVVDVTATVQSVLAGGPAGDHIRQSPPDPTLRVAGGELEAIDGRFYLVFGQTYTGFYWKNDHDGDYTYQIRQFRVDDDGKAVSVVAGTCVGSKATDPQFHRRDMNVVEAIRPDGRRGLTVYGGVFDNDDFGAPNGGPFRRPIDINPAGERPDVRVDATGFQQQLCQYNCAVLPMHRGSDGSMAVVFFGGISEASYTGPGFLWDENLPFVDHIACITRSPAGTSREWLACRPVPGASPVPLRLPSLLGTAARFIPAEGAPFDGGVLDLDAIRAETLVGYVYGGIEATRGSGGRSQASGRILAIWISPRPSPALAVPPPASRSLPSPQGPAR